MDPELKIATYNTMPNQEYALYGSVLESQVETLLSRLKGLCGTLPGNGEPLEDHNIVYILKSASPPISVRAVRSTLFSSVPWRFQYYGAESADMKTVSQRQIIDACCSVKMPRFLEELGFTIEAEYILKGFLFAKGRVKISVGRLYKVNSPRDGSTGVERGEPITGSNFVEISAVAFGGSSDPQPTHTDVTQIAELLRPIVKMERIDARRFSDEIGGKLLK